MCGLTVSAAPKRLVSADTGRRPIVATETSTKAKLHHRAMHELKELAIISAYLYVTIGAVIMMKTAVLGKFVRLGNMVHVGGRDISGPLIWPTLRRAFAFLVLLVVLTIIEEAVVGLFRGRSVAASLGELAGGDAGRLPDHAAGADPVLCLRVLSEALGEGRLERMFFIAREPERK